jgi:hypothetical protein
MQIAEHQWEQQCALEEAKRTWIDKRAWEIERVLLSIDKYGRSNSDSKELWVKPRYSFSDKPCSIWDEFADWVQQNLTGSDWLRDIARGRSHKYVEAFAAEFAQHESESLSYDDLVFKEVF